MLVFLVIFAIISVAHIIFILLEKTKPRYMSKLLIVPPLLAAYIAGAETPLLFPVFALTLGWLGDLLLIRIEKKICFKLGLASFLLGHLCYIFTFIWFLGFFGIEGTGRLNITILTICMPVAIIGGLLLLRLIKPSKEMFIPVIVYMIVIQTMTILGLQVLIFNPGFAGALVFLGCVCFMFSDSVLAYFTFRKINRYGTALLMSFYILAQAGIIMGVMSLTGALF